MSILTREGFRAMRETAEEALRRSSNAVNVPVSYTHLTLPTT